MIITAMYLYGIIQGSWEFSWLRIIACLIVDGVFIWLLSPEVSVNVTNKISDEEKDYWAKRTQVEELNRIELDRCLYGGKR